jgi:ArsR family transcriptional regulator
MSYNRAAAQISSVLKTISPAPRLAILLAIGGGEACVCHLEALLGHRQAYISQHLMALRQAGVLLDRREGRFVYYRIADPGLLELVQGFASLSGAELPARPSVVACVCPHCAAASAEESQLIQIEIDL